MIVEYIRYRIDGTRGAAFLADYARAAQVLARAPQCVDYELTAVAGEGAAVPSLYDWAGGLPALERLTRLFYERVLADDLIGPLFAHMDDEHPRHVALWLGEGFGGPHGDTRE